MVSMLVALTEIVVYVYILLATLALVMILLAFGTLLRLWSKGRDSDQ